jgi:hypothetical protein
MIFNRVETVKNYSVVTFWIHEWSYMPPEAQRALTNSRCSRLETFVWAIYNLGCLASCYTFIRCVSVLPFYYSTGCFMYTLNRRLCQSIDAEAKKNLETLRASLIACKVPDQVPNEGKLGQLVIGWPPQHLATGNCRKSEFLWWKRKLALKLATVVHAENSRRHVNNSQHIPLALTSLVHSLTLNFSPTDHIFSKMGFIT